MAFATINKGASYYNGLPYTGTNTSTAYNNGLNMSTNGGLVWLKLRSGGTGDHGLFDSVRGTTKRIRSNTTNAEDTLSGVTSFDSTGFTLGTAYNDTPYTFMSWSWIAGGTGVSNTSGTITSTVSANTTSGFSVVSYTGTGANATVGHGLGVAPDMIICKSRTQAQNWATYHSSLGNTKAIFLDGTGAATTSSSYWNNTSPTSTVFTVGNSGDVNYNAGTQISYCFSSVKGYSKFSSYTGNGSTDGTFVYTGFKPAYLLIKRSDSVSQWRVWDNKRNTYNVTDTVLLPNDSGADVTNSSQYVDLLSNGFKWRASYVDTNASGGTFIYAAFAENPFVLTDGTPVTAR